MQYYCMNRLIEYNNCEIIKNDWFNRNCILQRCRIYQTLSNKPVLYNRSWLYDCYLEVSGTFAGITITSSTDFEFDFIGNRVIFKDANSNDYLFKGNSFTGNIRNNIITGAKTTTLWHSDLGGSSNNVINGTVS